MTKNVERCELIEGFLNEPEQFKQRFERVLQSTPNNGAPNKTEFWLYFFLGGALAVQNIGTLKEKILDVCFSLEIDKGISVLKIAFKMDGNKVVFRSILVVREDSNITFHQYIKYVKYTSAELESVGKQFNLKNDIDITNANSKMLLFNIKKKDNIRFDDNNTLGDRLKKRTSNFIRVQPLQEIIQDDDQSTSVILDEKLNLIVDLNDKDFTNDRNSQGENEFEDKIKKEVNPFFEQLIELYNNHPILSKSSEASYHGFVYGLFVLNYRDKYWIDTSVEQNSGRGVLDLSLLFKKNSDGVRAEYAPHIILEFKQGEQLCQSAQTAIRQIRHKGYAYKLIGRTKSKYAIGVGINFNREDPRERLEVTAQPTIDNPEKDLFSAITELDQLDKETIKKGIREIYYLTHPQELLSRVLIGGLLSKDDISYKKIYVVRGIPGNDKATIFLLKTHTGNIIVSIMETEEDKMFTLYSPKDSLRHLTRSNPSTEVITIKKEVDSAIASILKEEDIKNGKKIYIKINPKGKEFENSANSYYQDIQIQDLQSINSAVAINNYETCILGESIKVKELIKELQKIANSGEESPKSLEKLQDALFKLRASISSENDFKSVLYGMFLYNTLGVIPITEKSLGTGKADLILTFLDNHHPLLLELKYSNTNLGSHNDQQLKSYIRHSRVLTHKSHLDGIILRFNNKAQDQLDIIQIRSVSDTVQHSPAISPDSSPLRQETNNKMVDLSRGESSATNQLLPPVQLASPNKGPMQQLQRQITINQSPQRKHPAAEELELKNKIPKLESLSQMLKSADSIELSSRHVLSHTSSCNGPANRHKRAKCAVEDRSEDDLFYPISLEAGDKRLEIKARLHAQVVMMINWQYNINDREQNLLNIVTYNKHVGDIIRQSHKSQKEQRILTDRYIAAQQFSNSYKDVLKEQRNGKNWLFDNGKCNLLVLSYDNKYLLYSPDLNYQKVLITKELVSVKEIERFIQDFFKWHSGNNDYKVFTLSANAEIAAKIIDLQLSFFKPNLAKPDIDLLLEREQSISGLSAQTVLALFLLDNKVIGQEKLSSKLFELYPNRLTIRIDQLHKALPSLTNEEARLLFLAIKKHNIAADNQYVNVDQANRSLLESYNQKIIEKIQSSLEVGIDDLSQISWQCLEESMEERSIPNALKVDSLKNSKTLFTNVRKVMGFAGQGLFFLPDIIRTANSGNAVSLLENIGMVAGDITLNTLYSNLIGKLESLLSENRIVILKTLPFTSPIFKILVIHSIVELSGKLSTLPANSPERDIIKHQLEEQYFTIGLVMAEVCGLELGPLWIALMIEQLVYSAFVFKETYKLDVSFWKALKMSLGFDHDELEQILENRHLVDMNLRIFNQINNAFSQKKWQEVKEDEVPIETRIAANQYKRSDCSRLIDKLLYEGCRKIEFVNYNFKLTQYLKDKVTLRSTVIYTDQFIKELQMKICRILRITPVRNYVINIDKIKNTFEKLSMKPEPGLISYHLDKEICGKSIRREYSLNREQKEDISQIIEEVMWFESESRKWEKKIDDSNPIIGWSIIRVPKIVSSDWQPVNEIDVPQDIKSKFTGYAFSAPYFLLSPEIVCSTEKDYPLVEIENFRGRIKSGIYTNKTYIKPNIGLHARPILLACCKPKNITDWEQKLYYTNPEEQVNIDLTTHYKKKCQDNSIFLDNIPKIKNEYQDEAHTNSDTYRNCQNHNLGSLQKEKDGLQTESYSRIPTVGDDRIVANISQYNMLPILMGNTLHNLYTIVDNSIKYGIPTPISLSEYHKCAVDISREFTTFYADRQSFNNSAAQRKFFVAFDPKEGNMSLALHSLGLEVFDQLNKGNNPYYNLNDVNSHYTVIVWVADKAYPNNIVFPQAKHKASTFILQDDSKLVKTQYHISNTSKEFSIRDNSSDTSIIINNEQLYVNGTGNHIYLYSKTNRIGHIFFENIKDYLTLHLNSNLISGTLEINVKHLKVLYATATKIDSLLDQYHNTIKLLPNVQSFFMRLARDIEVISECTTFNLMKHQAGSIHTVDYECNKILNHETCTIDLGTEFKTAIEKLKVTNMPYPMINTLRAIEFITKEFHGTWSTSAVTHNIFEIKGIIDQKPANLRIMSDKSILFVYTSDNKLINQEIIYYYSKPELSLNIAQSELAFTGVLSRGQYDRSYYYNDHKSQRIDWSLWRYHSLEFQSIKGFRTLYHFNIGESININNISYRMYADRDKHEMLLPLGDNAICALLTNSTKLDGSNMLRYNFEYDSNTRIVPICVNSRLKDSTILKLPGCLKINSSLLCNITNKTRLYFNDLSSPVSVKLLQDTLKSDTDSDNVSITSTDASPKAYDIINHIHFKSKDRISSKPLTTSSVPVKLLQDTLKSDTDSDNISITSTDASPKAYDIINHIHFKSKDRISSKPLTTSSHTIKDHIRHANHKALHSINQQLDKLSPEVVSAVKYFAGRDLRTIDDIHDLRNLKQVIDNDKNQATIALACLIVKSYYQQSHQVSNKIHLLTIVSQFFGIEQKITNSLIKKAQKGEDVFLDFINQHQQPLEEVLQKTVLDNILNDKHHHVIRAADKTLEINEYATSGASSSILSPINNICNWLKEGIIELASHILKLPNILPTTAANTIPECNDDYTYYIQESLAEADTSEKKIPVITEKIMDDEYYDALETLPQIIKAINSNTSEIIPANYPKTRLQITPGVGSKAMLVNDEIINYCGYHNNNNTPKLLLSHGENNNTQFIQDLKWCESLMLAEVITRSITGEKYRQTILLSPIQERAIEIYQIEQKVHAGLQKMTALFGDYDSEDQDNQDIAQQFYFEDLDDDYNVYLDGDQYIQDIKYLFHS
ncbi:PD-(D/E)XK nuclease domain-containing protein [Rickettsia amblyommatis]|nr:PD-(D/E)XK nuclease domain-containing protein [Rickettsia amblyommatis]